MLRPRVHAPVVVTVLAGLALFEAACSSSTPEEQLLTTFFRAARVRDNTTLGNIAAVTLNPRSDGTVEQFEIVSIGQEQRRGIDLKTLVAEEAKAKDEE